MSIGVGLLNPKVQFLDDLGHPLANGAVFFSIPGTLIARGTYSDAALTIPNADPVILDAAGRATIYLDPVLSYKVTVLDAPSGNVIYTQDNIYTGPFGLISPDGVTWLGRIYADSAQTATVGASLEGHTFRSTLAKAASGTNPIFSGVVMYPPSIIGSGAAVSVAATLTLAGAPSGGVANYALYVTTGATLFNGNVTVAGTFVGLSTLQGTQLSTILTGLTHGMTALATTETYGQFVPGNGVSGGAGIAGWSSDNVGIVLRAYVTNATSNTVTTASLAPIVLNALLKSSNTAGALGASKLVAVFQNNGLTQHALDGDGDSYQNIGTAWVNFDDHDDILALDALALHVSRSDDPFKESIRNQFVDSLDEMFPRAALERMKLVNFNDDGQHFVNMSKLAMLHTGALRQIGRELKAVAAQNLALSAEVARLRDRTDAPELRS